jgi:hypothetical protein
MLVTLCVTHCFVVPSASAMSPTRLGPEEPSSREVEARRLELLLDGSGDREE